MVALSTLLLCAALTATPDAVLLEFYSPACGPCQTMQPTIERLQKEGYPIQQINVEQAPDVARQFQIRHVPTCVLVVEGKEVARLDGVRSRDDIERVFQQAAAARQAAQQVAAQAQQQAEDFTVRGQSPEPRRGLGLFNKLSGRQGQDPGEPPMQMPASAGEATFGRDDVFSRHQPATQQQPHVTPPANVIPERTASAPQSQQTPAESPASGTPAERALAATVRLKVEDPAGMSFGTGTIIDVLKDEALIVTCGHIFRDSQGKGKILVDLHVAEARQPVLGQLISFDLTRDIALVSVRPGVAITPVPVAFDKGRIVEGTRVFSIGCDHGREPSVHDSRVVAIDKYVGSPNYTVSGMPVQGRSGGGLFTADGTLIGICNAADEKDNEGLYAGLGTIHWQLDKIGQSAIYQKQAAAAAHAVAEMPRNVAPNHVPSSTPLDVYADEVAPQSLPPSGREIIVFVRDKNQPHTGQAIVIDNPTRELMDALSRASGPQPTSLRSLPEAPPTVIRGQSHE